MEEHKKKSGRARAARTGKRKQRRYYKQSRAGIMSILGVVVVLLAAMSVQIFTLHQKNEGYKARERQLEAELKDEEGRREEIAAYEAYVMTPEYIEQIAKTKLGLIYSNEIIFKEKKPEQ